MKILFLLTQDLESPYGSGRCLPFSAALARLGHQMSIAALHSHFNDLEQDQFEYEGVNVWYVGQMHVRKQDNKKIYFPVHQMVSVAATATWKLGQAALASQAEIIYIGKPHPMNSLGGLAAKWLQGKHLCLDCDDYEIGSGNFGAEWQKKVVGLFEKGMPGHVRLISTNTDFMRQKLISWGAPTERIFYLPNGVDRARFQTPHPEAVSELRHRLDLGEKPIVLYLGSMSLASHAIDLLLESFTSILAACPQAVLLLVGGGEDYDRLKNQSRSLGIEPALRWIGRVPPEQTVLYYSLAQVSVDPVYDDDAARSRSPLKMFESWASGTPFVSADIGDRKALSGSPPASLLTKPGDSEELATAILQILNDPNAAEVLRQRGLKNIEAYYWDRLAVNADLYLQKFG
jgi:glycosyltransferase involved in cell wall biosynthesis